MDAYQASIQMKLINRIRELKALLDECEDIMKEAAEEVDWPILEKIEAFLTKLRPQESD